MKTAIIFVLAILPLIGFSQQVQLVSPLQDSLIETSGLILLNDRLITHNDSGGETALYEIDSTSGGISRKVIIENATNIDWEDICYDDTYIYVADCGNNAGTRTNLRVYRVLISDYLNTPNDTIIADTILFNYADQTDFTPATFSTNFDAEALISWNDSLYIFTKNWGNMWTNVYALPKDPGNYSIPRIDSIDVQGFITGGSFNSSSNSIILSGHTITYPIVVEISNFSTSLFSNATVERTQIQLPAGYSYQFEAIAPISANNYYITSEQGSTGDPGLYRLDMTSTNSTSELSNLAYSIYPNPSSDYVAIECEIDIRLELIDAAGRTILTSHEKKVDLSEIQNGTYLLMLTDENGNTIAVEKIMIE